MTFSIEASRQRVAQIKAQPHWVIGDIPMLVKIAEDALDELDECTKIIIQSLTAGLPGGNLDDHTQIPEHTMEGLQRYIEDRTPPGGFLYAVLTNDLAGAYTHADALNQPKIGHIVSYLWNKAPHACWGSVEKVEGWLNNEGTI